MAKGVDPNTGTTRSRLTSPPHCDVTGVVVSPDAKTLFVGIQRSSAASTVANPKRFSRWPTVRWSTAPDGPTPLPCGRARPGVVVITEHDGGFSGG